MELAARLDPLGDRDQAERVGEADEVGGDRRVLGVVLDALDERAVDLDHVDREAAQLAERREAGAEVVDRDPHAEVVQLLELVAGAVAGGALGDDRGLGDLEPEAASAAARSPRARCRTSSLIAACRELLAREVHPGRRTARASSPSRRQRAVCSQASREHELAQRHDQAGRLGDRDELVGRHDAAGRRVPAQRAPRRRRSRRLSSVDLGLVVDAELAALEPEPQLVLEPEQLAELARHLVAGTPRSGRARPPWPRTSRRRRAGSAPRSSPDPPGCSDDADARADHQLAAGDRDRLRQAARAGGAATSTASGLVGALEQQRELVAAEPRERVARPRDRRRTARRPACSSWSPASWPRLSLTCLKPSRSTSSTASASRDARGPRERLVEPVAEQRAVRRGPVSAVVERLPGQLLLEPHALGHVARVEHDAADVPVAAQVGDVGLEVTPLAEPVAHAEHDLAAARRASRRPRRAARSSGWTKLHEAVAEQLLLGAAEHRRHRLAGVAAAAGAEDEHEVGRGRDEAAEVRGLPACRGDQRPGEQQRGEQPERRRAPTWSVIRSLMFASVGAGDRPRRR